MDVQFTEHQIRTFWDATVDVATSERKRISTYVYREVDQGKYKYRVDIRRWYCRKRDNIWVPTKKGIYFDIEFLGAIVAKFARLYDRYQKQNSKTSGSERK